MLRPRFMPRRNTTRTFTYTVSVRTSDTHDNAEDRIEALITRDLGHVFDGSLVEVRPLHTRIHHQG